MERLDTTGSAGEFNEMECDARERWASALDEAAIHDELDAADQELFEDDLITLIAQRPGRRRQHCRA